MARKSKKEEQRYVPRYLFGKAKVSSKGWVVIPKEMRDEMGIKPGDTLSFTLVPPYPGMKQDPRLIELHAIKAPASVREALEITSGVFPPKPGEPSWTENLLRDRREEVEREEREIRAARRRRRKSA